MSEWLRVVCFTVIAIILGILLRELGFKGARLVSLLATVGVVGAAALCVKEIFDALPSVSADNSEYARAILKMVGAGYVFGMCSDICSEVGESGLSGAVCLFGRVEIIALSLPFIKRIVEKGIELI